MDTELEKEMSLSITINMKVEGNLSPARFADTVGAALPDNDFLHGMRTATIPAILPVTYRLGRNAQITIDDA